MNALVESIGDLTPDAAGLAMLREWLERFADLHRQFGPVIRAWTEAEIDTSAFGRLGTDLLGGFTTALGNRIAAQPRRRARAATRRARDRGDGRKVQLLRHDRPDRRRRRPHRHAGGGHLRFPVRLDVAS